MITQIADRMIFQPTRNPVSTLGKARRLIEYRHGFVEAWTQRIGTSNTRDVDVFVLKFAGKDERAERANYQPLDSWPDLNGEVWSINPPGYGGSSGRASLRTFAAAAKAAYDEITKVAAGRPLILMGSSLGTISALYLASRFPIGGMILRNPLPLRQLIVGKHGWWNLWIGAMLVSTQVPDYLCSIRNASRCHGIPTVFVGSARDQIVPPPYQARIVKAYTGPKRIMRLRKANHSTPMNAIEQIRFRSELEWLRSRALQSIDVLAAR
jgi:pimeloyl-ACP methyl ester carboxylesterase